MRRGYRKCFPSGRAEVSTYLPGAESLEEEEERKAPDHRGADDAEQRDELDPLPAPELGRGRRRGRGDG